MAMAPHPYGWNARGALYDVAQEIEQRVLMLANPVRHGINPRKLEDIGSSDLRLLLDVRAAVALVDGLHDLIESLPGAGRGA